MTYIVNKNSLENEDRGENSDNANSVGISEEIDIDMPYAIKIKGRKEEVLIRGRAVLELLNDTDTEITSIRLIRNEEMYKFKAIIG